jgi:4-carboxymuconolactone decarboxylase
MAMRTATHAEKLQKIVSDNTDVGTFGRLIETPLKDMGADMKSTYDFMMNLRGIVPVPHKIYLANPKLLQAIAPTGAYFQTESTLTKAEIEIATNVINSRWGTAYTNHEHEKVGIELGQLAPEKVAALIAGLPTSFDDPRQQVVFELSATLAAARVVPACFRFPFVSSPQATSPKPASGSDTGSPQLSHRRSEWDLSVGIPHTNILLTESPTSGSSALPSAFACHSAFSGSLLSILLRMNAQIVP